MKQEEASKKKSSVVMHTATVAMNPARALTSHLRHRYERRYRGRYQHAPLVFGFDLFLLGIAASLVGLNIFLLLATPQPMQKVGLYFSAPPIVTATPIAFEAKVVSRDTVAHRNVSLRWDFPANTEVLSSVPTASSDHEVYLGTLAPGQTLETRIVVRLFLPPGSAKIGFRLRDDQGYLAGNAERPIMRTALRLEPLIEPARLVQGASIPFLLANDSDRALEDVRIVVNRYDDLPVATFSSVPPLSVRTVQISPGRYFASGLRPWELPVRIQAMSHGIALSDRKLSVSLATSTFPAARIAPEPSAPGKDAVIDVETREPIKLLVSHPALRDAADHIRVFDVGAGTSRVVVPVDPNIVPKETEWFAVLYVERAGGTELGLTVKGVLTTAFSVASVARYYGAQGDQIGIGPLPPRVGMTTKYWMHWKLGATTADLSHVEFRAPLPPDVVLTGRVALPDGGTLTQEGNDVVWSTPFVAAGGPGISASFELALTPTPAMRGKIAPLLLETKSQAAENRSGLTLTADAPALDSGLLGDEKAAGKGIVK